MARSYSLEIVEVNTADVSEAFPIYNIGTLMSTFGTNTRALYARKSADIKQLTLKFTVNIYSSAKLFPL